MSDLILVSGAGGGSSPMLTASVNLSSADLLAIGTTAKMLVASVTGSLIIPQRVVLVFAGGTVAYTNVTGTLMVYTAPSAVAAVTIPWSQTATGTGFFNTATGAKDFLYLDCEASKNAQQGSTTTAAAATQSLYFGMSSSPTLGNGTMVATVFYYLVAI